MNKILLENGFEYEINEKFESFWTQSIYRDGKRLLCWNSSSDFRNFEGVEFLFECEAEAYAENNSSFLDALSALKAYAISEGYLKP